MVVGDCGFRTRSSCLIFLVDSNPSITGIEISGGISAKKTLHSSPDRFRCLPIRIQLKLEGLAANVSRASRPFEAVL